MANLNGRVLRQNCSCRVYPYLDTLRNLFVAKSNSSYSFKPTRGINQIYDYSISNDFHRNAGSNSMIAHSKS